MLFLLSKAFSAKVCMIVFKAYQMKPMCFSIKKFRRPGSAYLEIYTDFPEDYCNTKHLGIISVADTEIVKGGVKVQ